MSVIPHFGHNTLSMKPALWPIKRDLRNTPIHRRPELIELSVHLLDGFTLCVQNVLKSFSYFGVLFIPLKPPEHTYSFSMRYFVTINLMLAISSTTRFNTSVCPASSASCFSRIIIH